MPRFSIIIPAYNAEKRIKKSLESLIVQTYADFEVIVVDDGSTDSTASIVTTYSNKDSRIKLYRKTNSGVSSSRNFGLSKTKGDYITFVDSDDEVTANYLESLEREIINTGADIIFFGYLSLDESNQSSGIHIAPPLAESVTNYEKVEHLNDNNLYGYAWSKCIKRKCIGSIQYRGDLSLLEDEIFIGEVICNVNRIVILPEPLYLYYTGNRDSLSGKTYQNYCEICNEAFKTWEQFFPAKHKAIRKKALSLFKQCMFYAFERDVNFSAFMQSLRDTSFIRHLSDSSRWINMVRCGQLHRLRFHKFLYTAKTHLSQIKNSYFNHA